MKKYEERKQFLLELEKYIIYYPFTPVNEEIIIEYHKFTGAKVSKKFGTCNLLSRDFKRMYDEKLLKRYVMGNENCRGQGKPRYSYIYESYSK